MKINVYVETTASSSWNSKYSLFCLQCVFWYGTLKNIRLYIVLLYIYVYVCLHMSAISRNRIASTIIFKLYTFKAYSLQKNCLWVKWGDNTVATFFGKVLIIYFLN